MTNYMKERGPRISVVTASFNQGRFIQDCIRSVLDQGYREFEHIVVDNCSTDETGKVLEQFPHLKCIVEPDTGQSDAINKGIAAATGEWILWLNADDFMLPGTFEAFLSVIQGDKGLNVVYGHVRFVNEAGEPVRRVCHIPYHYFMTLFGVYMPPSTGTFFKAELLKNNPLDTQYHYVMDTEWFLRCGRRIKTKVLHRSCSAFRVSADNKTAQQIVHHIVKPRHAQEREMNYNRYVRPVLQRFGCAESLIYRLGHGVALLWYKAAKAGAMIRDGSDQ